MQSELIKKLFDSEYSQLLYYSVKITKDIEASKDILSDTFVKLLLIEKEELSWQELKNYIYVTSKNKTLDYVRELKRHARSNKEYGYLQDIIESNIEKPSAAMINLVYEKVDALPKKTRLVMQLFLLGNTSDEICKKLGITIGNCLNIKQFGISKIQDSLNIKHAH